MKKNIIINKAGGNASKNSVAYKIGLPVDMVKALGVTHENRLVDVNFVDGKIVISKINNMP